MKIEMTHGELTTIACGVGVGITCAGVVIAILIAASARYKDIVEYQKELKPKAKVIGTP